MSALSQLRKFCKDNNCDLRIEHRRGDSLEVCVDAPVGKQFNGELHGLVACDCCEEYNPNVKQAKEDCAASLLKITEFGLVDCPANCDCKE